MEAIGYHLITRDNAALLDAAEKGVFDGKVKADFVAACLANPNQFLIVAEADGRAIGKALAYVFFFPDKPAEIYVEEIDVAKPWRRRGIGSALLEAVGAEGKRRGIAEFWLVAEKDNKPARKLYERTAHRKEKSVWYEFYC
jgi:ribosomal protein S18 acetylase RimI-like enzyme